MFYQLDFGYILKWIDGFTLASYKNKEGFVDYKKARSILSTILNANVHYEALSDSRDRSLLSDNDIANLKQRFRYAVAFHQFNPNLTSDEFESDLLGLNKERAETINNDMVLFKRVDQEAWPQEANTLYLIDRLTGDSWEIDTANRSREEQLCPVLCHSYCKLLRDKELAPTNLPDEVTKSAMNHIPHKVSLKNHECFMEAEEELWVPLIRVKNTTVIPFTQLNEIDFESDEVLYMAGVGGLSNWVNHEPHFLRTFLKENDTSFVEHSDWYLLSSIVLKSGIVATALVERGFPNLVGATTYNEACLFRAAHVEFEAYASHSLGETLFVEEASSAVENAYLSCVSSIAQKVNAHKGNTIPVGIPNTNFEGETLLSLLAKGENLALIPTDQENNLFSTPDDVSDIQVDCLIVSADIEGKREIFRIPTRIKPGRISKKRLAEFTENLTGRELLALYCSYSKIGFGEDGNLFVSDPSNVKWEDKGVLSSFKNMTPMLTSNSETSKLFELDNVFAESDIHYAPYGLMRKVPQFCPPQPLSGTNSPLKEANTISEAIDDELRKIEKNSSKHLITLRSIIQEYWRDMCIEDEISDLSYSQFSESGVLVGDFYSEVFKDMEAALAFQWSKTDHP